MDKLEWGIIPKEPGFYFFRTPAFRACYGSPREKANHKRGWIVRICYVEKERGVRSKKRQRSFMFTGDVTVNTEGGFYPGCMISDSEIFTEGQWAGPIPYPAEPCEVKVLPCKDEQDSAVETKKERKNAR